MVMVASFDAAFKVVPEKEDPEKAAAEPTEAKTAMAENFMLTFPD